MRTPRVFIAYAPRAGLRCAVAYLESGRDVYGWFLAPDEGAWHGRYFVLEDYHAPVETRPMVFPEDELYSGFLDEARSHELSRLRDLIEHEWIAWPHDPAARGDLASYASAQLAVGEVAVRYSRLGRLSKLNIPWTFYSPAFESGVLEALAPHLSPTARPAQALPA